MRTGIAYALIVATGLAAGGCTSSEERVREINDSLAEGSQVLTVKLSETEVGPGVEARYYDNDGDRKTVEEYLLTYVSGGAMKGPILNSWKTHLLRKGAKSNMFGGRPVQITRAMTPAEEKKLDAAYQMLLGCVPLGTAKKYE